MFDGVRANYIIRILFFESIISLFLKFIDADPNILQIDLGKKNVDLLKVLVLLMTYIYLTCTI